MVLLVERCKLREEFSLDHASQSGESSQSRESSQITLNRFKLRKIGIGNSNYSVGIRTFSVGLWRNCSPMSDLPISTIYLKSKIYLMFGTFVDVGLRNIKSECSRTCSFLLLRDEEV